MNLPDHMIVTRVYEATPEQIWSAFTDPDQLCEFFGPDGTHCPRESITVDVRVGGEFRLTMQSDDGDDAWPMEAEFYSGSVIGTHKTMDQLGEHLAGVRS